MSDQTPNAPVPADEGENTTPVSQKKSLWARAKARKERFAGDHPFAAELGRQIGYGAAYMAGIIAIAAAYTAVTAGGSSSEETPDELESAPEDDILEDDEE